jgi:hypothetical protein
MAFQRFHLHCISAIVLQEAGDDPACLRGQWM